MLFCISNKFSLKTTREGYSHEPWTFEKLWTSIVNLSLLMNELWGTHVTICLKKKRKHVLSCIILPELIKTITNQKSHY